MTLGKYALLAQRTSRKEPGIDHMTNGVLGLIGEAGEVVETVKKWRFQSEHDMPMPVCKLIEELGDVMWYVVEFCRAINVSIEDLPVKDPFSQYDTLEQASVGLMHSIMCVVLDGQEADITDIISIIAHVSGILEDFCNVSMSDAMNLNINKLMKRYPEGFDAERSQNRDAE